MPEVASRFVSLVPSARGFGKTAEKQIGGEVDSAGKTLGKRLGTAMKVGAVGALAGVALAGGFIKGAINDSSDLAEATSKVGVVFGKQAADIRKASKTSAKAMGLSSAAYLDATGTLGNLLVSLDIAPKKSAKLSKEMVKLAGDLASFNNASPEDALEALKSGLTGETEPLKRFGVNMNDATLKAEALKLGLIKTVKDGLTPQAKALAAQSLIMSQTKTAQGDFARTSGGLANQQRILAAQFSDTKAKLGTVFLPTAERVFRFLNDTGIPALANVGHAFGDLREPVSDAAGEVRNAFGDVQDFFTIGAGSTPLKASLKFVKEAAGSIRDGFGEAAESIGAISDVASDIDLGSIDGKQIGATLGTAFLEGIKFLAKSAGKITSAIGDVMKSVDWVGVGIEIGKQAPALLLGLAAGILNFDLGSLLSGIGDHWVDVLFGVLFLAFAPAKLLGPITKILSKIPFVGRFLVQAVKWLNELGGKLTSFGGDLLKTFWKAFTGGRALPGAALVTRVLSAFKSIPGRVADFFVTLQTRIGVWALDAFGAMGRGAGSAVKALLKIVTFIPRQILKALGKMGSILYDAGKAIISGLIRGITDKLADLGKKLKDVGGFIKDHKGPPKEDAVMLRPAGRLIMDGLVDGIDDGIPDLRTQLRTVTGEIASTTPRLAAAAATTDVGSAAGLGGTRLRLVVADGTEFDAYIDDRADIRVGADSGINSMQRRAGGGK